MDAILWVGLAFIVIAMLGAFVGGIGTTLWIIGNIKEEPKEGMPWA
jgi:hypothetical protein